MSSPSLTTTPRRLRGGRLQKKPSGVAPPAPPGQGRGRWPERVFERWGGGSEDAGRVGGAGARRARKYLKIFFFASASSVCVRVWVGVVLVCMLSRFCGHFSSNLCRCRISPVWLPSSKRRAYRAKIGNPGGGRESSFGCAQTVPCIRQCLSSIKNSVLRFRNVDFRFFLVK